MKRFLLLAIAAALVPLTNASVVQASSYYQTGSVGVDVSYPNCGAKVSKADFGIVGVNGGMIYKYNDCLAEQASQFKDLSLYINTGLNASADSPYWLAAMEKSNDDTDRAAYIYGYDAAKDSLAYAAATGVSSDRWWLDVELENSWNSDVQLNRQSLQGAYDALKDHGASLIGVYSTTYQWNTITGSWQNQWPSWGATTWTTAKQAARYCKGHEFTGGPSLLMQFRSKRSSVSQDVAC